MTDSSIRTRVLTRLIRARWRTFCGLEQESLLKVMTEALTALEYEFSTETLDPTETERKMLGSNTSGFLLTVEEPTSFEVEIIPATVDPLTGAVTRFVLPEEKQREATADLCVVTVSPIDHKNRPTVASFLTSVIERCERRPWKVSHHMSFRLAILLRVKIRLLWTYWLAVDSRPPD
jgi:hypothetical protein